MRPNIRRNIEPSPLRPILSETLPFETPLGLNNHGIYASLSKAKGHFTEKGAFATRDRPGIHLILSIIFGKHNVEKRNDFLTVSAKALNRPSIPFSYTITSGNDKFRQLSIPHPASQLAIAKFYHQYKALILLHCEKSRDSLRRPARVARYSITKDYLFGILEDHRPTGREVKNGETDRLRSYFVYHDYDSVYKFYESGEYRALEEQYSWVLNLDIQKCFDSVYTHSITWAIYGKENVKYDKSIYTETFPGHFDNLAQGMNHSETNGIIIGPEISRIFAEIILQRVDLDVEQKLNRTGLVAGRDYVLRRYVDDYSIFIRSADLKDDITNALRSSLQPYRFHLNEHKEELRETPYISPLTMAKSEVAHFLRDGVRLTMKNGKYEFMGSRGKLITNYKSLLGTDEIHASQIAAFTLSEAERRLEKVARFFARLTNENDIQVKSQLGLLLVSTVQFAFYVYGSCRRVSTAVKISRLALTTLEIGSSAPIPAHLLAKLRHVLFEQLTSHLKRKPLEESSWVEPLYLLASLSELPEDAQLEEVELTRFLGLQTERQGELDIPEWFNPLIASEALTYIATAGAAYPTLSRRIEEWALKEWRSQVASQETSRNHGPALIPYLTFALLSSSCVSEQTKRIIVDHYKLKECSIDSILQDFEEFSSYWRDVDIRKELSYKRVREVY